MNQSLATLIKIKLFQGNNVSASGSTVENLDKEVQNEKKSRNWLKTGRSNNKGSPEPSADLSSLEPLASAPPKLHEPIEAGKNECENQDTDEESNDKSIANSYVPDSAGDESDSGQENIEEMCEQASSRRQGKLRTLKKRMSIPDLHFRSASASSRRHSRKSMEMSKKAEVAPPNGQFKSARVRSMLPASMSPKRSSIEYSYKTAMQHPKYSFENPNNETAKMSRTSSSSSSKSLSKLSPRKANMISGSSTGSSVRFIDTFNNGFNSNASSASSGKNKDRNGPISNVQPYHHSKTNSVEVKNATVNTLAIGRRRSRTVDVSDYARKTSSHLQQPSITNNDFISSITTRLKKSRSNSLLTKSPLASPMDKGVYPNSTTVHEKESGTPPRLVENITFLNASGASASQPAIPPMSRRSSSIVNALNTFVNLRSSSASSVKGSSSKVVTPKFDLKLEDFPSPPEPEANESFNCYLSRLAPYGKFLAVVLCQKSSDFKIECLNFYLSNFFDFEGDPLDISLRKLLMFLELPQETQQIDKLLTQFANCYYHKTKLRLGKYCPWSNENQVYLVVFSLLMLHTDFFNPNNKCKMSKTDFVHLVHEDHISGGCDIPKEILSYYYDNITAKESPKFDFSYHQNLLQEEKIEFREALGAEMASSEFYSPIAIIKSTSSGGSQDNTPILFTTGGGTSSNSFSSYFPQIPASNSSSNNSILQDDIDIYEHILDDSVISLNMSSQVESILSDYISIKNFIPRGKKYGKYFAILDEMKGGYLRLHKSQVGRLTLSNFEIINKSDDNDYLFLKIVHMGAISEMTVNKKFSIVGSVNKILWRKHYAILTSCGLLVFENGDWIEPSLVRDEGTGTSNYIIDYKPGSSILNMAPLTCNGVLATSKMSEIAECSPQKLATSDPDPEDNGAINSNPNEQDPIAPTEDACVLHLYASQKRFVWKCTSRHERDNWIDSINLMAAFDGCYYSPCFLGNGIITQRKHKVKQRLDKLNEAKEEKLKKLSAFQTVLQFHKQAIPLSYKTRNDLIFQIKQLAVKMDWLAYEIKRNQLYSEIIRQTISKFDQFLNQGFGECERESEDDLNSINESFIFNDELLRACLIDDSK